MRKETLALWVIIGLALLVAFDCPSPPILLTNIRAAAQEAYERVDAMPGLKFIFLFVVALPLAIAGVSIVSIMINWITSNRRF